MFDVLKSEIERCNEAVRGELAEKEADLLMHSGIASQQLGATSAP